jgi:phosphoribosyl 1,2-cyclic phosphodiesterase
MIKLYLDIDGVLLTAKHTRAADGVDEFVNFVTTHFECYWLTTHCKGDSRTVLKYLAQFMQPETMDKLKDAVRPTTWDALKTEAIDFKSDFYWLDDNPLQVEQKALEGKGVGDRLILVNLNRPEELILIESELTKYIFTE